MLEMLNSALLLQRMRANVWLSKQELEAVQRKKLRSLLVHAHENVPYYANLFRSSGIDPHDIKDVEDLVWIPTTSKLKLQSLPPEEILARGTRPENCIADVTSGSTGIPLHVYFTKEDYQFRSLMFIRTFMETGYRLKHRQAIVCDTRFVSSKAYWIQKVGLFRKLYVPVQASLERQIEMLRNYRPDYIHGYAVSLGVVAREIIRRGIRDIAPRGVCTGAELVSRRTREIINTAFQVDMVDTYATIESGVIAFECSAHRGYHINMDGVVVEFLKDGKRAQPGERGRVVITNLQSFAMPIIRYELGDVCVPSADSCPCGRALPLMSVVEGRVDDLVRTPSGKIISPNSITNTLEALEGINEFRVVQKSLDSMDVQLVKGRGFTMKVPNEVRQLLCELVGSDVAIHVVVVEQIPAEYTGKIRSVISLLATEGNLLHWDCS